MTGYLNWIEYSKNGSGKFTVPRRMCFSPTGFTKPPPAPVRPMISQPSRDMYTI